MCTKPTEPKNDLDLRDYLEYQELVKGWIRLYTHIDSSEAKDLIRRLHWVHERLPVENPITLSISSPGGDAYSALAVYDTLRKISTSRVVKGLVEGWAASAASMIVLQAATERLATPNSRFLLHEARRWVFWSIERTSDMIDEAKEMQALQDVVYTILSERSGRDKDEIRNLIDRKELWLSASEAKELRVIDRIVEVW